MTAWQSFLLDLNQLIPIVNHWFHLVSAVVWIGGLAFLVMAVTPGLQTAVPREYVKPAADVFYRHYKKIVGILLWVILITGGINVHYTNQFMKADLGLGMSQQGKYLIILFIKLSLVLGVMTLFLYTVLFRTEATGEETEEEQEENIREPVPYQRAAFWMGIFILLCASAMKHLH